MFNKDKDILDIGVLLNEDSERLEVMYEGFDMGYFILGMMDADLRALIDAVGDSIMLDANRLLIGSKAWSTRLEVYESSTAPYAGVAANFGAQQLADKLGLDGVFKSTERVETTSGKAKVVNSAYAVAFVGVDGATDLDPSSLKRFWSPCDGGEMFRIYRDEKAKWVDITVEHYSNIVNTVAGGAKAISVS